MLRGFEMWKLSGLPLYLASTTSTNIASLMDCSWIALGLLLDCSWIALGLLLDCSWIALGLLLDCSWIALGLLRDCSWIAHGLLMDCSGIAQGLIDLFIDCPSRPCGSYAAYNYKYRGPIPHF
jgi:hypothetical protein